jgi:glycine/D-amino acid oxidase-like deaminating enzyme
MAGAYGASKAEQIWKFTEYNHRLMVEEFGDSALWAAEYNQRGSWTLAATEHEIDVIGSTVSKLQDIGVNVEWHDADHVNKHFKCEGFHGGAHYKDDGEIHPVKYLDDLRWRVSRLPDEEGAFFLPLENHEVYGIKSKEDGIEIHATGVCIKAEAVVLCTNAWSSQLFPWFADKIAPTRGQIIVTEPVEHFLDPAYCSFVLDYFRQMKDGRVLIGGFRNVDIEKEVGLSDEVNPLIHKKLEGFLNKHFPSLRGKRIDYRWSGVMGFSADGYPMVGSLDEDPRIFYNVGFTAHGLGYTFATGELTAKLILNGQDPGIFSGRRFN